MYSHIPRVPLDGCRERGRFATTPPTMEFKFSYVSTYTDGWLEIREQDNIEAWIACDDPVSVES